MKIPAHRYVAALLLLLVYCLPSHAQTSAHRRCNNFDKGMNLSNWLEAHWQAGFPTANGYTFDDVAKMKAAGIQSLRLPIGFASLTDTIAPYTVDVNHPMFARIDTVISWCDALNMNLIIDNHHQWDIFNQNWRTKVDRLAHLWSVVAARYKNLDPERYTFELLNEPAFGITIDSLKILFNHAIDSVRQHTTAHSIIIGPNFASNGAAFAAFTPLQDTNLIYTWHCYDPYQFTHQGFSWASPSVPLGETFPGSFDQGLYTAWRTVINWQNTYNKPVFLGEFGTGVFADDASRCNWLNVHGSKIDSFNMSWFYWDWRWDFSLFNSNTISSDSVVPCFRSALHLYGDTVISAVPDVAHNAIEVHLFPNPASAYNGCNLYINSNDVADVTVFDMAGKNVFNTSFAQQIPLTGVFQRGVYIVAIKIGSQVMRKKLVLQ